MGDGGGSLPLSLLCFTFQGIRHADESVSSVSSVSKPAFVCAAHQCGRRQLHLVAPVRQCLIWKGGMLERLCTYPERGLGPGDPHGG
jgi:hypothetical protein